MNNENQFKIVKTKIIILFYGLFKVGNLKSKGIERGYQSSGLSIIETTLCNFSNETCPNN